MSRSELKQRLAMYIRDRDTRVKNIQKSLLSRPKPYVPGDGRCFWHSLLLHTKVDGSPIYDAMYRQYHSTTNSAQRNAVLIKLRQKVMQSVISIAQRYIRSNGSWNSNKAIKEIPEDLLMFFHHLFTFFEETPENRQNRLQWLSNYIELQVTPENPCNYAAEEAWASALEIKMASILLQLRIIVVSPTAVTIYADSEARGTIVIQHVNDNHFDLSLTPSAAKRVAKELYLLKNF